MAFDQRETGYNRERIDQKSVTMLDGSESAPEGDIWFYANKEKRYASAKYPIVQSYVDICWTGCLEIEATYPLAKKAAFAETFLKTSTNWNKYWVNDRSIGAGRLSMFPMQVRSIVHPILVPVCRGLQEGLRKRRFLRQRICRLDLGQPFKHMSSVRLYYWILCRSVALLFVGVEPYVAVRRRLAAVEHRDILLVDPFTVVAAFSLVECLELLRGHLNITPFQFEFARQPLQDT